MLATGCSPFFSNAELGLSIVRSLCFKISFYYCCRSLMILGEKEELCPFLQSVCQSMEKFRANIYSLMQIEIRQCKSMKQTESDQAECGYRVANKYCQKIRETWKGTIDYTDDDEINFFKVIKPLFTSHLEYYLI